MAVDGQGDVFVSDLGNNRVVEVMAGGAETTVGSGLSEPTGVAVDGQGDVFVADAGNNRAVEAQAGVPVTVTPGTPTVQAQSANAAHEAGVAIILASTDPDIPAPPPTDGFTVSDGTHTSAPATVSPDVRATVSGRVGAAWGSGGVATLRTAADGLGVPAPLSASDVSVTSADGISDGPVPVSGSGTSYTIAPARPIDDADRATATIGNASIAPFTRRLDVLPGDANHDREVAGADATPVNDADLGLSSAIPPLSLDVLGDGVVNPADDSPGARRKGIRLP